MAVQTDQSFFCKKSREQLFKKSARNPLNKLVLRRPSSCKILHINGNSVTDYPMATIREKRSSVPSLASEAVAAKRRHTSAGFQGKENAAPCSRPSGSKKPRLAPERLSQVPGSIREMGRGESTV